MPHELIYTSAIRGLHQGTDGYCIVAETPGMPRALAAQLDRLSGYRHRVKGKTPDLVNNPVAFSHNIIMVSGQRYHVLSRIADSGFDHTQRTNYLAHHIAFPPEEVPQADPAWLSLQPEFFQEEWPSTRKPKHLPPDRLMPNGDSPLRRCGLWEREAGDAGWAGFLAETQASRAPVYILYKPGQPVLKLLAEAIALLPPNQRWKVTFNTYHTDAGSADCQWRCVLADSREAEAVLASPSKLVIRLDQRLTCESAGEFVSAARTGIAPLVRKEAPRQEKTRQPAEMKYSRPPRRRSIPDYEEPNFVPQPGPVLTPGNEEVKTVSHGQFNTIASSPIKPLLLGLALGLGLALVGTSLFELAARKSLLQQFGVKSLIEEELENNFKVYKDKTNDDLFNKNAQNTELDETNKSLIEAKTKSDASVAKLTDENKSLKNELADKNKQLQHISSGPIRLTPISLEKGVYHLFPPGQKAQTELISPPLGGGIDKQNGVQTNGFIGLGKPKLAPNYDEKEGILSFDQNYYKNDAFVWSSAVLRVKPNDLPYQYFQLACPKLISLKDDWAKSPLNLYQELKLPETNKIFQDKLAFSGPATVNVKGVDYMLRDVNSPPDGKNFPTVLTYSGLDNNPKIELSIKDGKVAVTVEGFDFKPEGQNKIKVKWAEIVPREQLLNLPVQPVILRITAPD